MQNRIFLNSLNNGVIILDKELHVRFWNTWLEAHTGKIFVEEKGKKLHGTSSGDYEQYSFKCR